MDKCDLPNVDAIDLAIQRQALDIELQLHELHTKPRKIRVPVYHNFHRTPVVAGFDSAIKAPGGIRPGDTENPDLPVESNRHSSNPKADCFDQVHVFPKGRWS